jgi:hypothetical protein
MADFCAQCAKDLFGPEVSNDLEHLWPEADFAGGKTVTVLCEGCGVIEVNYAGECVHCDLKAGTPGHGPKL